MKPENVSKIEQEIAHGNPLAFAKKIKVTDKNKSILSKKKITVELKDQEI